jgi:dihydropteroate synthase
MGVINVTPDSFSGDGIYKRPEAAAELAERMAAAGADVLDVGGESTRPGFTPVPAEEELERVIPAVRRIVSRVDVPVSVDTSKSEVAVQALAEGVSIINDVSGLRDPNLAPSVAASDGWLVLVHNGAAPQGEDIMISICRDLRRQIEIAESAGVARSRILIDPGLGMRKGWQSNLTIIRRLHELHSLRRPLLLGPSRKGMIARVLGNEPEAPLYGTVALVSLCIAQGADVIRVHDVRQMAPVARVMDVISRTPVPTDATVHL